MKHSESAYISKIQALLIFILLIVLISIIIQDYSGYLSTCIFNRLQNIYYALSISSIIITVLLIILIYSTKRKKTILLISMFFITVLFCELILRTFDYTIIDRPDGFSLLSRTYNHNDIYLMKPTNTNSLGFNDDHEYTKKIPKNTTRLIFLGDSYTYGPLKDIKRNYCEVVESYLNSNSKKKSRFSMPVFRDILPTIV